MERPVKPAAVNTNSANKEDHLFAIGGLLASQLVRNLYKFEWLVPLWNLPIRDPAV